MFEGGTKAKHREHSLCLLYEVGQVFEGGTMAKHTKHSLCFLYEVHLVFGDGPHGLENDSKVVADGELVVELTAGSCALHLCKYHQ